MGGTRVAGDAETGPWAHSANPQGRRHLLREHLDGTAAKASDFASAFDCGDFGRLLGLYHDAGKASSGFCAYLDAQEDGAPGMKVDHKAAGCVLGRGPLGVATLALQGHHGGLPGPSEHSAWFASRMDAPDVQDAIGWFHREFPDCDGPMPLRWPSWSLAGDAAASRSTEMLVRMLFSTLVDADFLDTEEHFHAERAAQRGTAPPLDVLADRFARRLPGLLRERRPSRLDRWRTDLRDAAVASASAPTGLYRMSAPTGSGKTIAAIAFALAHARHHDLRRVVVAVPFLGITTQTAAVTRRLVADDDDVVEAVLEHHSGLSAFDDPESPGWDKARIRHRLATENWDASLIITTTVQLFDSLFARNPSACRKLHRLARSVIVIDEVQCLPVHLASPITDALRELVEHYSATVLMTTATQPAFELLEPLASLRIAELCPDPEAFTDAFRRVRWREEGTKTWDQIAADLSGSPHALAVVNARRDAQSLVAALGTDPSVLHLSTTMSHAHRAEILAQVADRLRQGEPCRLVATQVAEAGLDLDFPLVIRAVAPLPSLAQAAGRCNREGHHREGTVVVVEPADGRLPRDASYRIGTGVTRTILDGTRLPDTPDSTFTYYERLFASLGANGTDTEHIQTLRAALEYPETARRFRLVDDNGISVVVRYGESRIDEHLAALRSGQGSPRMALRGLQPHVVGLQPWEHKRARKQGLCVEVIPGLDEWTGPYDPVIGIDLRGDCPRTPGRSAIRADHLG